MSPNSSELQSAQDEDGQDNFQPSIKQRIRTKKLKQPFQENALKIIGSFIIIIICLVLKANVAIWRSGEKEEETMGNGEQTPSMDEPDPGSRWMPNVIDDQISPSRSKDVTGARRGVPLRRVNRYRKENTINVRCNRPLMRKLN